MKYTPDIDIDVVDRKQVLENLFYTPASQIENGELRQHNVGVYFQDIPQDPITGLASIPYKEADARGYFKVDFLPNNVYRDVKNEAHLIELMNREPEWGMLEVREIVEFPLFQIHGHFETVSAMKPKSIEQLAMVLALIRPAKKHLIGRDWDEIKKEIWTINETDQYQFRKSHAFAYAVAIVVQMNNILEQAQADLGSDILAN